MFLVTFRFLVFFAVTLIVYYLMPKRFQWCVLLISSMVFYFLAATPYTIIYLLISIVVTWAGGNFIEKCNQKLENCTSDKKEEIDKYKKQAKTIFILSVLINLGILAALKYMNFILGNAKMIFNILGHGDKINTVSWIASLGVSFYTLQIIGYLADSYWGITKPQKNIFKLALFTSYFPQMSSGPIIRYNQLENQLYINHTFDYNNICMGLQRMLIGFFKKLVIAEHLAIYSNIIFSDTFTYTGLYIWIGTAIYIVQLYADFAGCMDIVLGVSQCFGIVLPENFNRPFHSRSIQEFWQRWHITLGTWLKDYIMYPILHSKTWNKMAKNIKKRYGKKASKQIPTFLGMLILWFCMGLWHGGGWNFIFEGIWFWVVIVLGQVFEKQLQDLNKELNINTESKLYHGFQSIRTTLIYAVGVVFFKAYSLGDAFTLFKRSLSLRQIQISIHELNVQISDLFAKDSNILQTKISDILVILYGILFLIAVSILEAKEENIPIWLSKQKIVVRWVIIYILIFSVILFGAYGPGYNAADFIYGGF